MEAKKAADQKKSEEDAKQLLLENANIVKKLTDEEFSENMNNKAQEIAQQKAQQEEAAKAAEEAKNKNAPKAVDDQIKSNLAESVATMTTPPEKKEEKVAAPEPVKNIFVKKNEEVPKAVKNVISSASVPA